MALYYVGLVAPVDYPALYALCDRQLPDTFEEWRIIEDQARREAVAAGHHVIGLHVDLIDLRDYCRAADIAIDLRALHALATRIGNERFATQAEYVALRNETVVVEDVRTGTVAQEEALGGPLVRAPRRHWWQAWGRPAIVSPLDATVVTPFTVEVPKRRWWQFWRRRAVVVPGDARPLTIAEADAAGRPIAAAPPRRRYARVA